MCNNHTALCNAISTEKCSCLSEISSVTELRDENDRLRKANEELVKILKEMAECSYFDDAEGPELRAQNANLHRLAKQALQSSESDK